MKELTEIPASEFNENVFDAIGKTWMIVSAEKDGRVNGMTASWGGLGVLWNKNVAYIFIRPQRYTKEFVDTASELSLSFFKDDSRREMMNYFGRVSGRDEDKIAKCSLTVCHSENVPYYAEADITIICKKLYVQKFEPECFIESVLCKANYPLQDYHYMYICEIEKILVK